MEKTMKFLVFALVAIKLSDTALILPMESPNGQTAALSAENSPVGPLDFSQQVTFHDGVQQKGFYLNIFGSLASEPKYGRIAEMHLPVVGAKGVYLPILTQDYSQDSLQPNKWSINLGVRDSAVKARVSKDAGELAIANAVINKHALISGFAAEELIVATWKDVILYNDYKMQRVINGYAVKTNTFQAVVARQGVKAVLISVLDTINMPVNGAAEYMMAGYQINEGSVAKAHCQAPYGVSKDVLKYLCRTNALTKGVYVLPLSAGIVPASPADSSCFPASPALGSVDSFCAGEDTNECGTPKDNCHSNATCSEKAGPGVTCACKSGFTGNGVSQCADINECLPTNPCGTLKCTNTIGGHICECGDGYTSNAQNQCVDIDECTAGTDTCDKATSTCTNTAGSFKCNCKSTFAQAPGNDKLCIDRNECTDKSNDCHASATCTNIPNGGGFKCTCNAGYTGDGKSCSDINECGTSADTCDAAKSTCTNTAGGFRCACKTGYSQGNTDKICQDINECKVSTDTCDKAISDCQNTDGGFQCACKTGYTQGATDKLCADINECGTSANTCDAAKSTCTNTAGGFRCACKTGYKQGATDKLCADVDECQTNNGGCNHNCINNDGSFKCSCNPGSTLANGGLQCDDVNECNNNNGGCSQNCVNKVDGFNCTCNAGYSLGADDKTCDDINECATNNGGCSDTCKNTQGSFTCACNTGYTLAVDKRRCGDIDECLGNHGCVLPSKCENFPGGFRCGCGAGYSGSPGNCVNIDECAIHGNDGHTCHANATCFDNTGSYDCTCKKGFSGNGRQCDDINECLENNGGCNVNAVCEDLPGSVKCTCKAGFEGNGQNCFDINECKTNRGGCHANADCVNNLGSFSCSCQNGFTGDGKTCTEVDECLDSKLNDCHVNATCTNTVASFICACNSGFSGDGKTCTDINECTGSNNCDSVKATCTNTIGGFFCTCKAGYAGPGETGTCLDVNECKANNGGCDTNADCVNSDGSFTCSCRAGYTGDGKTCANINECNTAANDCHNQAVCADTIGSYTCTCKAGFTGSGKACADINECTTTNGGCNVNADCVNTAGSRTCACKAGYTGDGLTCSDVNECQTGAYVCHANATCANNVGSYDCVCDKGFSGNGKSCANVNECNDNAANNCNAQATCIDNVGSFSCKCNSGWSGDGVTCSDINECTTGQNACHHNATCANTIGSYTCTCNKGYSGSGRSCNDINECNGGHDCDTNADCINLDHNGFRGFACACRAGYTGNGTFCAEECSLTTCPGASVCIDLPTGANCKCIDGYFKQNGTCSAGQIVQSGMTMDRVCNSDLLNTTTVAFNNLAVQVESAVDGNLKAKNMNTHKAVKVTAFTCGSVVATFEVIYPIGVTVDPAAVSNNINTAITSGDFSSLNVNTTVTQAATLINPCDRNNGGCHSQATCTNNNGVPQCSCNTGFTGNGITCNDINECLISSANNCDQNANCTNLVYNSTTGIGFECKCKIGFSGNGVTCTDINECNANPNPCSVNGNCNNTIGSYICACNTGYTGDGASCVDINECDNMDFYCKYHNGYQDCINKPGSHECHCKQGFSHTTNQFAPCVDVDECASHTHNCSTKPHSTCENTAGGFNCNCPSSGFTVNATNGDCEDINECLTLFGADNKCSFITNAACQNTIGDYTCYCAPGFTVLSAGGKIIGCSDINECTNGQHTCDGGATCISTGTTNEYNCGNSTCYNKAPSFECACHVGFTGNGSYCTDFNECDFPEANDCHKEATCTNVNFFQGRYTCACKPGFSGNGTHCTNINECAPGGGHDCHGDATCTDSHGNFSCQCNVGFSGNGTHCMDINECSINTHNCHQDANCNNTIGSFTCACKPGYLGNGTHCMDINECANATLNNCHVNANCTNMGGTFGCTCKHGYTGNGTHCENIDECALMTDNCHANATCTDHPGTFSCSCDKGFSGNGVMCADINECLNTTICHRNATCNNTYGSFYCTCDKPTVGDGFICRGVGIYAGSANTTGVGIHEQEIELLDIPDGVDVKHMILSAVTGNFPGTVIQNKHYDMLTHQAGIMLFSPQSAITSTFDWLVVDKFNFRDKIFQFGTIQVTFNAFDKCMDIQFDQEMEATPSISITLFAEHKLDPFFFDYSLAWATNITATGFRACIHEAVLFSGEHKVGLTYIAVSQSQSEPYGALTENGKMTFKSRVLPKYFTDEEDMYQFCQKYNFENRYISEPPVFVTSEVDTIDPSAGEQTTWLRKVTDRYAYVCTKNSEDDDLKRNFQANVSIIVAGPKPFHPCMGKTPPTNLDCHAQVAAPGYYFDCWKLNDCGDEPHSWVCSSDMGTYKSDCHMRAETCELYGKVMVANVTNGLGGQKCAGANGIPSDPPVQTGQTEIDELPGNDGLACKVITLNSTIFHDYSDVLIATSVSFPKKKNHGLFQAGVASWTEQATKASFKACVKVTGAAYDTAVYGHPHVDWVAYQKNVHRRINNIGEKAYVAGDTLTVPNFRRGVKCMPIDNSKITIDNSTRVMVSVHHTIKDQFFSSAVAWMETDNADVSGTKFRVCIKGVEVFSSPMNELRVNWFAFNPAGAMANGDTRIQTIGDLTYSNSDAATNNVAVCKNVTDDSMFTSGRTNLVTVNALVPNNVFSVDNSRYATFNTWTETTDNSTMGPSTDAHVCYSSSWPGTTILDSMVSLLSFDSMGNN